MFDSLHIYMHQLPPGERAEDADAIFSQLTLPQGRCHCGIYCQSMEINRYDKNTKKSGKTLNMAQSNSQLCGLDVSRCSLDGVAVIAGELGDYLQQGGAVVLHRLTIAVEPRLVLGAQHGHPGFKVRQAVPDVVHEQPAEGPGQMA